MVLAFWNTFPAFTPAQSLRRWDGAHTGPFGERHGLSILLDNVRKTRVPVVLLDFRNPLSLSAVDALGALPEILQLESENLIILPDMLQGSPTYPVFPTGLPDWGVQYNFLDNERASATFGLKSSQILYSPANQDGGFSNYQVIFTNMNGMNDSSLQDERILPIPHEHPIEQQATPDGPNISIRQILLDNVSKINHGIRDIPVLILGGSFPESSFGDPHSAQATLSYIDNHPWIHPMGISDLITLPPQTTQQIFAGETDPVHIKSFTPSDVLFTIPVPSDKSQHPLHQSAWEAAKALYAQLPPESDTLPELRSNYSGQPGIILAAATWAENPQPIHNCITDPDQDGTPECILSTDQLFAVFDVEGGRLISLYKLMANSLHQIIAPTTQFIIGLADPSTWLLEAGEGADPEGVHGAFADSEPPWETYRPKISEESLTLSSPNGHIEKRFSLTARGLHIEYHNHKPLNVKIPFAIDPWNRFTQDWKESYQLNPISNGYELTYSDELEVEMLTDASITGHIFTQSPGRHDVPENPNFDYPHGHYLPYPMAIMELRSPGNFTLELNIRSLTD
jgi:hypothetical protein